MKENAKQKENMKENAKEKEKLSKIAKEEVVLKENTQKHNKSPLIISPNLTDFELEYCDEYYDEISEEEGFEIKMRIKIEKQPVCIAIGDIDGNYKRLANICDFINENQSLDFVFIGDLFDDISEPSEAFHNNWKCISLVTELNIKDEYEIKLDSENLKINKEKDDKTVYLPSAFKQLRFGGMDYKNIPNCVKFIAGNLECVALLDLQSDYEQVGDQYVFKKESKSFK